MELVAVTQVLATDESRFSIDDSRACLRGFRRKEKRFLDGGIAEHNHYGRESIVVRDDIAYGSRIRIYVVPARALTKVRRNEGFELTVVP